MDIFISVSYPLEVVVETENALIKIDAINGYDFNQSRGGYIQSNQLGNGTYADL